MISLDELNSVVGQYEKHGWEFRRVLATAKFRESLESEIAGPYPNAEIGNYELDALWFSRRSRPDAETWELRRLTGTPYALVTDVEDGLGAEEFESHLRETEDQMIEASNPRPQTGNLN